MSHSNIYIRKENELAWRGIADKSAWVNERLEKRHPLIAASDTSVGSSGKVPAAVKAPIGSSWKPCRHGSDPRLCKHAKFDKTRKEKWCKGFVFSLKRD